MGIEDAIGKAAEAIQAKGPVAWALAVEATRAQAAWEAAGCGIGVAIGLVGIIGGLVFARRIPGMRYVGGEEKWTDVHEPWAGAKRGEPWAIAGLCVAGLSILPFALNAVNAAGWLARMSHPEAFTAADLLSRLGR